MANIDAAQALGDELDILLEHVEAIPRALAQVVAKQVGPEPDLAPWLDRLRARVQHGQQLLADSLSVMEGFLSTADANNASNSAAAAPSAPAAAGSTPMRPAVAEQSAPGPEQSPPTAIGQAAQQAPTDEAPLTVTEGDKVPTPADEAPLTVTEGDTAPAPADDDQPGVAEHATTPPATLGGAVLPPGPTSAPSSADVATLPVQLPAYKLAEGASVGQVDLSKWDGLPVSNPITRQVGGPAFRWIGEGAPTEADGVGDVLVPVD